jgi:hypothetical protein
MTADDHIDPVKTAAADEASWNSDRSQLFLRSPAAWRLSTIGWFRIDDGSIFLIGVEVGLGKFETGLSTEIVKKSLTFQKSLEATVLSSARRIYLQYPPVFSLVLYSIRHYLKQNQKVSIRSRIYRSPRVSELNISEVSALMHGDWFGLFDVAKLSVVCAECGRVLTFERSISGLCPDACFARMSKRGDRALEKARQMRRMQEARHRIARDPEGARVSVHTVPWPGPTQ